MLEKFSKCSYSELSKYNFLVLFLNIYTALVIARENSGTNNKQHDFMIWLALKWTMPSVNPKFTFFKLTFNDQTVLNLITPPNEKFNKCQKVISWLPWFGGSVCYQPWWLRFSESLSLKILALQIENTLNTIPGFIKKEILPTVWIHFQTDIWWVIR